MSARISLQLDRVGATYKAGETITGSLRVYNASSTMHFGIDLSARGLLFVSSKGPSSSFLEHQTAVAPLEMLSVKILIRPKGERLPAGEVELPFAFDLVPSALGAGSGKPMEDAVQSSVLFETYKGVHISCVYKVVASVYGLISKDDSEPVTFKVVCPGQGLPPPQALLDDVGVTFELSEENIRTKRFNGSVVPSFLVEGKFDKYYNDIDVPLAGWIVVRRCSMRIVSIELLLLRVESAVIPTALAREVTELQSIQIAEGDVLRNLEIPLYMFFPRWYTCPSIKTSTMRVDFEIHVIITLEDRNQIIKSIPIKIYRSPTA